ncbi:MAG: ABC transporter ATP-binding protein [Candidatus Fermentibacteraceae bacterium]|nr:ABC transporter ATP-binding protein [Candidatus Fermentibacteraceae bacterium]MBN2607750.1 ABC transporter ATP-binding protein [Candidatus Fermentibacteraceae bacterium]
MSIISVDGLRKTYGDLVAVDNISFQARKGEILGILGPNGSGKTTTLKSILGLITFDSGSITVKDVNVQKSRTRAVGHMGAILEGARNIYWYLSPKENLIYFAGIKGYSRRSVTSRIDRLLTELGLDDVRDKEVREFSSGMKQKTALACALVHDPEILLLDEPTLGLDVETSSSVRGMLRSLVKDRGKTILITSHDMSFVESVCDRVLIIREGSIVSHETITSLRQKFANKIYLLELRGPVGEDFRGRMTDDFGGVIEQSASGEVTVNLRLDAPMQLLDVLSMVREHGITLEDIRVVESSLEDIFLDLIGKIWE